MASPDPELKLHSKSNKWNNKHLKRFSPYEKKKLDLEQSNVSLPRQSSKPTNVVCFKKTKPEIELSETSFNVSINFDSFIKSQNYLNENNISLNLSSNSIDSQESQPIKQRIQDRLMRCPSSSLYDTRKKAEEDFKNSALELMLNEFDSQPGLELGPFFGLPTRVAELFATCRGISQLYEWQEECVKEGIEGGNLLISLPTSGGKTLVAEILMLRQILIFQKNVLVILPYVTLVQEKVRGLAPFAVDLQFVVEEYAGSKGKFPPKKRKKNVVFIATIEKANILIDSILEEERVDELGLVVVDEVHMLGDTGGRGAKLETALVKLRYFAKSTQIVSMSATVGNVKELSTFLDAQLYTGSFRPIPLTEYVKIGDQIAEVNPKAHSFEDLTLSMHTYSPPVWEKSKAAHPDCIMGLISDIIPKNSCLIFCPTRRNVEAIAEVLKSRLPQEFLNHKEKEKKALLRALKVEIGDNSICPVLRKTIPYGVAYHHSGLTEGERKLVEEGYQDGTLCCLVCTSTLAAGVNLPARRVVIRSPYVGRDFLTRSRYQQMIGRAGRAGLDSKGESYIVASQRDREKVADLLLSPIENCISKMNENEFEGLSDLIFSMLGLKIIDSLDKILEMVHLSLLYIQAKDFQVNVEQKVKELLQNQCFKGFVFLKKEINRLKDKSNDRGNCTNSDTNGDEESNVGKNEKPNKLLSVSRLGKAAIKGGINLSLASQLYNDLLAARSHLVLHSHMHLLYLITPYNIHESIVFKPLVFSNIYLKLSNEELEVANILGISEGVAVQLIRGASTKVDKSILNRFYATIILHKLTNGENILNVSETFEVHRGTIQQLLHSAASFASSVNRFCQELDELWAFRDLFGNFSRKLSLSCSPELVSLMELPAVKAGRARLLHRAGFKTLRDLANAEAKAIVNSVDFLSYKVAYQIISSAKMLLFQQADALKEEADDLLNGLGNDPETSFLSTYKNAT